MESQPVLSQKIVETKRLTSRLGGWVSAGTRPTSSSQATGRCPRTQGRPTAKGRRISSSIQVKTSPATSMFRRFTQRPAAMTRKGAATASDSGTP